MLMWMRMCASRMRRYSYLLSLSSSALSLSSALPRRPPADTCRPLAVTRLLFTPSLDIANQPTVQSTRPDAELPAASAQYVLLIHTPTFPTCSALDVSVRIVPREPRVVLGFNPDSHVLARVQLFQKSPRVRLIYLGACRLLTYISVPDDVLV